MDELMKTTCLTLLAVLFTTVAVAHGQTTAPSAALTDGPPDPAFEQSVDLAPLRTMAVQHAQTVKTFDSYARQTLDQISGRTSYHGQDPVFTVLDIAYRPRAYAGLNLIKIKSVPLRTEFRKLAFLDTAEQERIVSTGLISLELASRPEVVHLLQAAQSADVRKGQAVDQFAAALSAMDGLCSSMRGHDLFVPVAAVPPATTTSGPAWHRIIELAGTDPDSVELVKQIATATGGTPPPALPGYKPDAAHAVVNAAIALHRAWTQQDAQLATNAASTLASSVQAVDPTVYPSQLQRNVEVLYNRLAKMTLPGAACYFFALVCFVAAANSGVGSLRLWGLRLLALGLVIHTLGIGVRWWLSGSAYIPIKNEFESVMFSAWFGALIGFGLELGLIQYVVRGLLSTVAGTERVAGTPVRNLFGAAASFVGWLALILLFTVPYVFGTSIGQEIGQSAGVLMSYWLYIHVTMVTASYALIGMGFLLSVWWLIKYYADYGTLSRLSQRQLEGEVRGFDVVLPGGGRNAGAAAVSFPTTLAQMVFFPVAKQPALVVTRKAAAVAEVNPTVGFLATLDACNLVVLQMAFWVLGTGIVLGAVWADQSWGRFWAWDPKETFAAVTWIVYLVTVHVRIATEHKAWWTAVLATGGFFVMLFNWIGVNYFLHGLHSYAG